MSLRRTFGLEWIFAITVVLIVGCGEGQLVRAIRQGDSKLAAKLIDEDVNVNAKGAEGVTALHVAINANDRQTFLKLLEHRADPNICDDRGSSVIHLAAENADVFWLREILRHGGNPDQLNTGNIHYPDSTPIFYAIHQYRLDNIKELIDMGADVNHKNCNGTTPAIAAMESFVDAAAPLLEAGADPTVVDKAGRSLLNYWLTKRVEKVTIDKETKRQAAIAKQIVLDKGYVIEEAKE